MRENFAKAIALTFGYEGGWALKKSEPGGAVDRGVTMETFIKWRHDRGQPTPSFDDLHNLTEDEATTIYRSLYADKVQFDALPKGLDFATLDFSINAGLGAAARALATAIGFRHTSPLYSVSPELAAAASKAPVVATIDMLCDLRLAGMRQSSSWERAHRGWEARVASVRQNAKAMAAAG